MTGEEERTPSQVLIGALEDFSVSEPKCLMVVWLCEDGAIAMTHSTGIEMTMKLGLLDIAKELMLRKFVREKEVRPDDETL